MPETPLTIGSIVDEVLDTAQGYVRGQDLRTSLAADLTANGLTFTVTNANSMSVGPVEIDDELVQVARVDPATSVVSVEPWGRGQGGTTAATHTAGARVAIAPLFPRERVRTAVYGVLREIFPDVFAVATTTLDGSPVRTNFTMPDDCHHVLRVETKLIGPSLMWSAVPRWRQNKQPAAVELEVIGPVVIGTGRVRALYIRTPGALTSATDLTTYGYDSSIRDVVVLGATARLMAYAEANRVNAQSMEAHGRSEATPVGASISMSRMLDQRFRQRVEQERMQLLNRYPTQPHFTR